MDKDRTHCSRNTPCIHPLQCPAAYSNTHTHTRTLTHTQGVLSLMAVRSESDKLTSPANTVHWECGSLCVCVCVREWGREQQRETADVLLHITNMIYSRTIWVCIPTMRSVRIKNRSGTERLYTVTVSSRSTSITSDQNLTRVPYSLFKVMSPWQYPPKIHPPAFLSVAFFSTSLLTPICYFPQMTPFSSPTLP